MPYNAKQYDTALNYLSGGADNVVGEWDKKRVQVYDLYENLYNNSSFHLRLQIRGEDQTSILIPSGKKIIEATNRFLGIGFDYFLEPIGDQGLRNTVEAWAKQWWKRESVAQKFASNKRWGLIRGDAVFYIYGRPNKPSGERISIAEIDPRQVFLIEDPDDPNQLLGVHMVEEVQDFRDPDPNKKIAKRRTFRRELTEDGEAFTGGITTELTYWETGEWDDRQADHDPAKRIRNAELDEEETLLPESITQLPIYKWRNNPPQNSSWGVSQMSGLETVFYAINQAITDEDATIVFQGLGMYVTTAKPPLDPATNEVAAWNVGPAQVIEIGENQKFDRVSGVSTVAPFKEHIDLLNDKGIEEAAGIPALAVGKVDPSITGSGISMKMDLMPLLAANAEKELEFISVLDQMLHDIVTMWLPAYETEYENGAFRDLASMAELSMVSVFDDPMPVDRDARIQETLLLNTSNLILTSMAIAKLRELGWEYPTVGPNGEELTDDDIAQMLNEQAKASADAAAGSFGMGTGAETDEFGNPIEGGNEQTPPEPQTFDLA